MLSENRKFNYTAELNINRSKNIDLEALPKDDVVNWLFILLDDIQYSFIYKIEKPLEAKYSKPFSVYVAFTVFELVKDRVQLNFNYTVMRGQENIGHIKLIDKLKTPKK